LVAPSRIILPIHCVQAIQNVFAEVAEVGAVTTAPDGEPLTQISNPCAFCSLILSTESGRQACIASWRELAGKPEHLTRFASCHAGLQYARARIEVDGDFTAMLVAGQFHAAAPTPEEEAALIRRLAETHGLEAQALAEAARELPVLSQKRQARIGSWLETVAHTFEDIGHERSVLMRRLRRIAEMSMLDAPEPV
jgi:ligand-binding sensor protein